MTPLSLDETLVTAAHSALEPHTWILALAVAVANWGILLLPVILLGLWLRGGPVARQSTITATLSATVALTVAGIISFVFYEPRPFALGLTPNFLDHVADSSFPSDHVAIMAAVAAALWLGTYRSLAGLVALALLAVGAARVALGVHFPSDILAATAIGMIVAGIFCLSPAIEFATFCRRLAEAVYAGLGLEAAATRIHLQKNREITR